MKFLLTIVIIFLLVACNESELNQPDVKTLCAYSANVIVSNSDKEKSQLAVRKSVALILQYLEDKLQAVDVNYGKWAYVTFVYEGRCNNTELRRFSNIFEKSKTTKYFDSEIIDVRHEVLMEDDRYDLVKLYQGFGKKPIRYEAIVKVSENKANVNLLDINKSFIQQNLPISLGSLQQSDTSVNYDFLLYAGFDQEEKIIEEAKLFFQDLHNTKDVSIRLNTVTIKSFTLQPDN